jgi:archaellum biogenesis ATPase FlaH
MYEIAKKYISKGISVIPVGLDKKPLIEWKEYQTRLATDEELQKWFSGTANIGIVTGKISGISVVDIDPRHGGSAKGLPPTLMAKTQGGGWHLYYHYLPGLPNKANVRPGIDIRSDGGYVIAPPSKGQDGEYEWVNIEDPQPFPADVLQVTTEKPKADWEKISTGVTEGGRNQAAAQFIGKLLPSFTPLEWGTVVWNTALHWNQSNTPPLTDEELRMVFNSITSREIRKKQEEDDAPVVLMSEAAKKFTQDATVSFPTGMEDLDKALGGGLREGNLVIIVGESGHGKSSYARTLTVNQLKNGTPSVWFTFELTIQEMWEKFQEMGMTDTSRIYTPERYVSKKLEWVKKKLIEARDVHKSRVAYIDHLGFLVGEYDGKYGNASSSNLSNVYSMICRDLKNIAVQENLIIVLMWHLRKLQTGKEVDSNDIKDSIGIIQECDLALSIQRDKAEGSNKGRDNVAEDVYAETSTVKMLKNRRTGKLKYFKLMMSNGILVSPNEANYPYKQDEVW